MRKTSSTIGLAKGRFFAGAGLAAMSLAAFATPAYAQDADADAPDCIDADGNGVCDSAEAPAEQQLIIVSGTRIAKPNLDSPVPVTTVEAGELLNDGALSLGDALNDAPP